ncbi:MAG: hypothetical protein AAGG07_07285 [Planctomycetota bacterium]
MNPEDRDVLFSRVIDGEATPEDWTALRALASDDASVWSELAALQQDHADLSAEVALAGEIAARTELPVREHLSDRMSHRFRVIGGWGGWAAAAAIVLAWATGMTGGVAPSGGSGIGGAQTAGLGPNTYQVADPDDALQLYLDKGTEGGRVIAEMPAKVLLEARPSPTGSGYEVMYYRQILERAIVPDLVGLGVDDAGQPTAVPVAVPAGSL